MLSVLLAAAVDVDNLCVSVMLFWLHFLFKRCTFIEFYNEINATPFVLIIYKWTTSKENLSLKFAPPGMWMSRARQLSYRDYKNPVTLDAGSWTTCFIDVSIHVTDKCDADQTAYVCRMINTFILLILAPSQVNLIFLHASNKSTYQPAHPCRWSVPLLLFAVLKV